VTVLQSERAIGGMECGEGGRMTFCRLAMHSSGLVANAVAGLLVIFFNLLIDVCLCKKFTGYERARK
jgi:hypothetical protein